MDKKSNTLNWFEISVSDMKRAKEFYQTAFDIQMDEQEMNGMLMAFFPWEQGSGKANGALCKSDFHKPSMDGSVIYLNANPEMTPVLERIGRLGGTIVMPKTHISDEIGYMAFFIDSEGNRMALHSQG